jgi:regulator of sirC expression with transglutaminase-like and TPR domain
VLEKQADELLQHFSAFDYPNAAAVYQSMQNILRAGQMKMPVAVERSIRPVVQWLQETESETEHLSEFQQAVEELRESLEDDTPREELEDLYYVLQNAAGRANQVVPPELDQYYLSRIDYLDRVARNRFRLVLAIFLGSIILVGVLFAYAMWKDSSEKRVNHTSETLQKLKAEIVQDNNAISKIEPILSGIASEDRFHCFGTTGNYRRHNGRRTNDIIDQWRGICFSLVSAGNVYVGQSF